MWSGICSQKSVRSSGLTCCFIKNLKGLKLCTMGLGGSPCVRSWYLQKKLRFPKTDGEYLVYHEKLMIRGEFLSPSTAHRIYNLVYAFKPVQKTSNGWSIKDCRSIAWVYPLPSIILLPATVESVLLKLFNPHSLKTGHNLVVSVAVEYTQSICHEM